MFAVKVLAAQGKMDQRQSAHLGGIHEAECETNTWEASRRRGEGQSERASQKHSIVSLFKHTPFRQHPVSMSRHHEPYCATCPALTLPR